MKKEKILSRELKNVDEGLYAVDKLKSEFVGALKEVGIDEENVKILRSPEGVRGDFGFHCANLSKIYRKKPEEIAKDLALIMKSHKNGVIREYVAEGQYLNCILDREKYLDEVVCQVIERGGDYGKEKIGNGQKVIIDMSSPNIAKRMSVGHLRSTIIGDSLARIYKMMDYEVVKDNHIGDWGTQFGHLLYALEISGSEDLIAKNPIEELQKLYVWISSLGDPESEVYQGVDKDVAKKQAETVMDMGRMWFRRLESGDSLAREKWKKIVDWSLADFERIYETLGVDFDMVRGESFYEGMLAGTIEYMKQIEVLEQSKGAWVVNMEDEGLKSAIVQKSDGATLYLTREIATALYRSEVDKADKMIYVVGEDQKFYFEQFFGILRKMDMELGESSKHVYFGMVRLPEGKMSTRKGRVVLLEDVIAEASERAESLVSQRTWIKSESEKKDLVKKVAIGALKWNDLMADPKRSIVFDWEAMLSLDGNSAPYVQYTYARANTLLNGAVGDEKFEGKYLVNDSEKKIVDELAVFPLVIREAALDYNPSRIASYIYSLSRMFNAYYQEVPILKEVDKRKKDARLALVASVAQVIESGLYLLGIEAPERM